MGETAHDGLAIPGRVMLAHETTFALAGCRVFPSTREIEFNGTRESVEPRIMQVLVVLARAGGQVVGRDELIQLCWDGRAVGDDAINRVIWRLRHILERIRPEHLRLQTIPRVGYRLIAAGHTESMDVADALKQPGVTQAATSRRSIIAGAFAGAGTLLFGLLAWTGQDRQYSPSPEAKHYFDRAIQLRGQMSVNQSEQSIAYLKEATRIDPKYSDAWGALAWGYRGLLEYGPRPDSERLKLFARSAAERALQLDPSNADARIALLLIEPFYGRWEQVEKGCRQILARVQTHKPDSQRD